MKKLNTKAGFTLAELLIVVAIIAILVAVGVPVFSTSMERSRETVDLSNIRGAYAEFIAGTLGGRADTGYYQVDIKQRDVNSWVADASGFLANVTNQRMPTNDDTGTGATKTTPADDAHKLTTGNMWVKFTFVGSDGKLMKTPEFSVVQLTYDSTDTKMPAPPSTVRKADGTGSDTSKKNVVEYYDEAEVTDTSKRTYGGYWYLTKEQTA
jgi:type IV pilus assembly protein PilA